MRPYAWRYVDVTCGDVTFVAIFMSAPVFSPRELTRERAGLPSGFAVNGAIYKAHRRVGWVYNEYATAEWGESRATIGGSRFVDNGDVIEVAIREPIDRGRALAFDAVLKSKVTRLAPIALQPPTSHFWQVAMARASAVLTHEGSVMSGTGYADRNYGDTPLGGDLRGWTWSRAHAGAHTSVTFDVFGSRRTLQVLANETATTAHETHALAAPKARTRWGLALPRAVLEGERWVSTGAVIDSAPFYARLQEGGRLTEVADFARYRKWWCWWMPYYRSAQVA